MASDISNTAVVIAEYYARDRISVIVAYRCVEFTLQASQTALGSHTAKIDTYTTNVDVLEGVVARDDISALEAHQALRQHVLALFAEQMHTLAPVPRELRTLKDAADCVKYTMTRRSNDHVEVTEQSRGPSYDLLPVDRTPTLEELERTVQYVKEDEVIFSNRTTPIRMLLGEVHLASDSAMRTQMFLKPAENGKGPGFRRALEVYAKISHFPQELRRVRIPQLLAIILLADGTAVLGFLTEWIDSIVLAEIDDRRRKNHQHVWRQQVVQSLEFLHTNGIIWGDPNAHNVLIDREDRAWIVDFSGGMTAAAELESSEENKQRELQTVKRLFEALLV